MQIDLTKEETELIIDVLTELFDIDELKCLKCTKIKKSS
jgi:hypothetical protein